jgi:hypothetical protein
MRHIHIQIVEPMVGHELRDLKDAAVAIDGSKQLPLSQLP